MLFLTDIDVILHILLSEHIAQYLTLKVSLCGMYLNIIMTSYMGGGGWMYFEVTLWVRNMDEIGPWEPPEDSEMNMLTQPYIHMI